MSGLNVDSATGSQSLIPLQAYLQIALSLSCIFIQGTVKGNVGPSHKEMVGDAYSVPHVFCAVYRNRP